MKHAKGSLFYSLLFIFYFFLFVLHSTWAEVLREKTTGLISPKVVVEASKAFEEQILRHVANAEFLQAIKASAEYEQNLLSWYPEATFEKGLFQSAAEHMSFRSKFDNWRKVGLDQLGLSKGIAEMGFNVLLALGGNTDEDRFFLCSVDVGQMEKRMGLQPTTDAGFTDREMMLMSESLAAGFRGVITTREFKEVGNHRVLAMEIDMPMPRPSIFLTTLASKRRLYLLVLTSSIGNYQQNKKQLFDTIGDIGFDYKPADEAKIESVRARFRGRTDTETVLSCVRSLAELGEYNSSVEELARLRLLLAQQMPRPYIDGNRAKDPVYGISVTNPDDKKWRLSLMLEGGLRGILIADRFSVREEGIVIQVLDPALAYGPQAAKAMSQMMDQKEFLTTVGHGAAMFSGHIERERFTPFKGGLAYDATVRVNFPGVKARILCAQERDFILMILMLADLNTFEEKIREYEKIVESCLQIEAKKPVSKPQGMKASDLDRRDRRVTADPLVSMETESARYQPVGEVLCLQGHTGSINGVAFSPDGNCAVSASSDETIRLWDVKTGKEIRQFVTKGSGVNCIVFFPDGQRVLSGHDDGTLRIWDINTGKKIQQFGTDGKKIKSLSISSDGKRVVLCDNYGKAQLWDIELSKKISRLTPPSMTGGNITCVTISKDGYRIAVGVEQTIDKTIWGGGLHEVPKVDFSLRGIVCVWELKAVEGVVRTELLKEVILDGAIVASVAFSPANSAVVFGGVGSFYLWQYESESAKQIVLKEWETTPYMRVFRGHTKPSKQLGRYDMSRIISLSFSSDGRSILSAGSDNAIRLWDVETRKELWRFTVQGITCVCFSPDGRLVISGSEDSTARIWELPEPKEHGKVAALDEAKPKDTTGGIPVSKSKDERLSNQRLCLVGHTDAVKEVAFSSDGRRAISASSDETIRLWDVKTGKEIRRFGMGGGGVNSVVFFPDGKRVLSAHSDGGLRIWDVSTGEELRRFGGKQGESVETVALSPDGRCAVSGRLHQPYLEFWDVETGELLQKYCLGRSKTPTFDPLAKSVEPYSLDENYGISHVAFSPDGLKVAAALERTPRGRELERGRSDGAAHVILEFFEGKPEYRRRREIQHWMDGPVVCISFSPDGQQLLFSGMGWIKVCDLTSEQQDTSSGKSHIRIFSGGHSEPDTKRPGYYGVHRVSGLAFSPDGQCALSGGYDNTVRLWDTKTGKELRRFLGHTEGVNCVGFSPDGRLAISGSKDSTVRIWELPEPVNLVESESRSVSVLTCAPRIVEAPSSIAEQYNNQGASYAKKGDYAMAILAYTSAITINPKYADAYHNRALAWFFKKDYDRAWADIERCRKTGGTPDPALIQALREVTERIE